MGARCAVTVLVVIAFLVVLLNFREAGMLLLGDHPEFGGSPAHLPSLPRVVVTKDSPIPLALYNASSRHVVVKGNRNVVLIHVGKTGGETVRHTLKVACRTRQNPTQKELCLDFFSNHTESALSRHTIGMLHCDLLYPPTSLDRATTLLWTIRSPVDRIVSWFNYMNPANCNPVEDYYSTACNTNRSIVAKLKNNKKGTLWPAKFFRCFPTINAWASALDSSHTNAVDDDCSPIAWRTIAGKASRSSGHVFYNYAFYWNRTLNEHRDKEFWVVRTESLWQDLKQVEDMFRKNKGAGHSWVEQKNVTHGSEGYSHRDQLSRPNLERLCCALANELVIYQTILQMASNLDESEKRRSLERLVQQCKRPCPTHERG